MIVLGSGSKSQPPLPQVVLEALIEPNCDPARQWLTLLYDEVAPQVLPVEGASVAWTSIWTKRPNAEVHFDIQGGPAGQASSAGPWGTSTTPVRP